MIDTRPAPRLPLDTASTVAVKEGVLGGCITYEPGEPVYQVSLLQTQTPNYWPSAFNREVYDKQISAVFLDQQSAVARVRPLLTVFSKTTPKPPQAGGGNA